MDKQFSKNSLMAAAALAINGAGNAAAKATNALVYKVDGTLYTATAAKTFTLSGTIATGNTGTYGLYIDTAGTTSVVVGSTVSGGASTQSFPIANLAQDIPGKCLVGWLVVRNNTGSVFTGGTTALDTASLTVSYVDNYGVIGQ